MEKWKGKEKRNKEEIGKERCILLKNLMYFLFTLNLGSSYALHESSVELRASYMRQLLPQCL